MKTLSRRSAVGAVALLTGIPRTGWANETRTFTVYRSSSCQCCEAWISHMTKAGYHAQTVLMDDLTDVRRRYKIPADLAACHTATIGGYGIEGHVPAADVTTLLRQRPKALGLSVPGMPLGSPGMEPANGEVEGYFTLLLLGEGRRRIFARH